MKLFGTAFNFSHHGNLKKNIVKRNEFLQEKLYNNINWQPIRKFNLSAKSPAIPAQSGNRSESFTQPAEVQVQFTFHTSLFSVKVCKLLTKHFVVR